MFTTKLFRHSLVCLVASACIAFAGNAYALSVDDIASMSSQGMGEAVLIQIIHATNDLPQMTKDDYARLQKAGVSNKVIAALAKRRTELDRAQRADGSSNDGRLIPAKDVVETPEAPAVIASDATTVTPIGSEPTSAEPEPTTVTTTPVVAAPAPETVSDAASTDAGSVPADAKAENESQAAPAVDVLVSSGDAILAPVESSNLPIILKKFFEETYEAFTVQAEVARRYSELQGETESEHANDIELPKIATYRAMIPNDPKAALGACLALRADTQPSARSLAAAALNQCIGEALYALNMPAMAAAYLDLALQAAAPVEDYSSTFMKFLDAAHRTEYLSSNPFPIRARANAIDEADKPAFMYFVGYSFVHGANADLNMARKTLAKIEPGTIHYVRAQILLASLDLRAPNYRFKSAAEALKRALDAVKQFDGDEPKRLENLAWLTLGRIAYENHAYDEADAFYRKVDVTSHQFVESVVENAWNRLFAGHPEETLGLTHALRAPRFEQSWQPDVLLLEAAAYLKLCRYDQAALAVDTLKARYIDYGAEISRFAASVLQRDYYNQVMIYAQNPTDSQLPDRLFDRIISDYGFYSLHTSLTKLTKERRVMRDLVGGALNGVDALIQAYDDAIAYRQQAMGVLIAGIIDSARSKLHALDISASQMTIDIRLARREREAACLKIVAEGGVCNDSGAVSSEPVYTKRDTDAFWNFNGEFWRDELLHYSSGLTSLCK